MQLAWHPGDVLDLTQWISGKEVDHADRVLSALLLRLSASNNYDLQSTGPLRVEICLAQVPEATGACERFLVWEIETSATDSSAALIARLLLLLFLLRLRAVIVMAAQRGAISTAVLLGVDAGGAGQGDRPPG